MKKIYLISIALFLFSLLSCSSYKPPKKYEFVNEREYQLKYDYVWTKILEYMSELGSPIKHMDKESGFINTEFVVPKEMYNRVMDCGVPGSGLSVNQLESPEGRLNIVVSKTADNVTKVRVNATLRCMYQSYMYQNGKWNLVGSQAINCNSKGYLEQNLLNYIR